jgi:polar amino acid transport system substrate-binding protein
MLCSFAHPLAIASEKTLSVGACEFAPFEYSSPEGKSIGADTEVIEQVLRRMGYNPEMKLLPWKRVETMGKNGHLAAVYSVIKNPEREKWFYFSDAINSSQTVFFKRKDNPLKWETFDDLKRFKVAISAGYAYPKVLTDAISQEKFAMVIETFGETPDLVNLKNLQDGRTDLVVCDVSVGQYLILKHAPKLNGIDYSSKPIGAVVYYYLAFSKKWPNAQLLTKEFNAELAKYKAAGHQKKIFQKYGITPVGNF